MTTRRNLKVLSDLEKHLDGFAGSVKMVLENSRHGTLKGVRGTVSQLIRVDSKYITAIETALGNAIQDIVTDTAATAKNAMLLLKNNRAGRATFLPLSELNPRPADKSEIKGNGIVGLAHELVKTNDADSEKAITFLLGRTVVCENIDDAISVSRAMKSKYKAVTLDGQVVNPGGSMTGGSTAKSAGLLSRSLEIEKLEKKTVEQTNRLEELDSVFSKAESEKNELSARLEGVLAEIRVLDEELLRITDIRSGKQMVADSYAELIEDSRKECDLIEQSMFEDKSRITELENQIKSKE